jgi:hypothetical protein
MKTLHTLKYRVLCVGLLLLSTVPLMAQPDLPDNPVPIGFIEVLFGIGALYGGKRIYDAKRN